MTDAAASQAAYAVEPGTSDIVCLSHLRWDFVFQRPQHLLTRFARERRVFYVEEPIHGSESPRLHVSRRDGGLRVVTPHLPSDAAGTRVDTLLKGLLDDLLAREEITNFVLWYYTAMALPFTRELEPVAVVYDCMDELSAFRGAPEGLVALERELLERADVVFTGGPSLYEAKRTRHPRVHLFPSSIDAAHFGRARGALGEPEDQRDLSRPRIGFFGVIDERLDVELLAGLAAARPEWQIVMIGPVVKIDPGVLPRRANLHYLGPKAYAELPDYIAGWDAALLPFARNESTRFISPTKTPEYLAAGRPVVSTPIRDVVRPYGEAGLVRIADTVPETVAALEAAMREDSGSSDWLAAVDRFLGRSSWDRTWSEMRARLEEAVRTPSPPFASNVP